MKMWLKTGIACAAGIIATGTLLAAPAEKTSCPKQGRGFSACRIETVDTNKDGTVTFEEFLEVRKKQARERFNAIDTDKDGKLNQTELQNVRKKSMGRRGRKGCAYGKRPGRGMDKHCGKREMQRRHMMRKRHMMRRGQYGGKGHHGMMHGKRRRGHELLWEKADLNKDGGITYEELKTARENMFKERFNKLDSNKDGKIDKSELEASRSKRKTPKEEKPQNK